MSAYITGLGAFLPGDPIPSDQIEEYIGAIPVVEPSLRDMVVENSGIKTRHYVIDRNQRTCVSSSTMSIRAIRRALESASVDADDIDYLGLASTGGDLIAPGLASMVHGEMGNRPCEIASIHGICASGMAALKTGFLQVKAGEARTAAVCATESSSRLMKSSRFQWATDEGKLAQEIAFLRYMLSDGSGAAIVQDAPSATGRSMRIEWITLTSFANQAPVCMYGGGGDDGAKSWMDYPSVAEAAADGALALRQNIKLLPRVMRVAGDEYERLVREGRFDPLAIRYAAVHYSSEGLKPLIFRDLSRRGVPAVPLERWFSNLPRVGNLGSASIFVILEELFSSDRLAPGDQVLCIVPESGRFAISYALLTVVEGNAAT